MFADIGTDGLTTYWKYIKEISSKRLLWHNCESELIWMLGHLTWPVVAGGDMGLNIVNNIVKDVG